MYSIYGNSYLFCWAYYWRTYGRFGKIFLTDWQNILSGFSLCLQVIFILSNCYLSIFECGLVYYIMEGFSLFYRDLKSCVMLYSIYFYFYFNLSWSVLGFFFSLLQAITKSTSFCLHYLNFKKFVYFVLMRSKMEQFFIFNKLENSLKSEVSSKHKKNYFSLLGS